MSFKRTRHTDNKKSYFILFSYVSLVFDSMLVGASVDEIRGYFLFEFDAEIGKARFEGRSASGTRCVEIAILPP